MIKSDLFVINKTDLAPHVGADLDVMAADSAVFRKDRPFCFTNLRTDEGLEQILAWIRHDVLMLDMAR
jgi:urease accessory protein